MIAFAWGPDDKLWVVEMTDYPLGVDGKGKPGGIIKYLEDTNGDGKYIKATVFLDNLPFPTGVMPWGKGVIVACAPEIFYAEDTTGSGRASFCGWVIHRRPRICRCSSSACSNIRSPAARSRIASSP